MYYIELKKEAIAPCIPTSVEMLWEKADTSFSLAHLAFETAEEARGMAEKTREEALAYMKDYEKSFQKMLKVQPMGFRAYDDSLENEVSLACCFYGWKKALTWVVVEKRYGPHEIRIVTLDQNGGRHSYDFATLADFAGYVKRQSECILTQEVLLVVDQGTVVYSSLMAAERISLAGVASWYAI